MILFAFNGIYWIPKFPGWLLSDPSSNKVTRMDQFEYLEFHSARIYPLLQSEVQRADSLRALYGNLGYSAEDYFSILAELRCIEDSTGYSQWESEIGILMSYAQQHCDAREEIVGTDSSLWEFYSAREAAFPELLASDQMRSKKIDVRGIPKLLGQLAIKVWHLFIFLFPFYLKGILPAFLWMLTVYDPKTEKWEYSGEKKWIGLWSSILYSLIWPETLWLSWRTLWEREKKERWLKAVYLSNSTSLLLPEEAKRRAKEFARSGRSYAEQREILEAQGFIPRASLVSLLLVSLTLVPKVHQAFDHVPQRVEVTQQVQDCWHQSDLSPPVSDWDWLAMIPSSIDVIAERLITFIPWEKVLLWPDPPVKKIFVIPILKNCF
jgi:hypothetical protein